MSAAASASVDDPLDVGSRGSVLARLRAIEGALEDLAGELAPERLAGHQVAGVVRVLRRIERRAGGARLLLADAAARTGLWRQQGFRSPEEWAARHNGTTVGEAKADLQAAKKLADLPMARDAVAAGEVSAEAAKAVAEGATADPGVERDLVNKARTGDLGEVRDTARRARQRADERDGKAAQRMHQRRALRSWIEVDGEGHGTWNVPPTYQAAFLAALEPYRDDALRAARHAGRRETPEALMADAMYMLCRDTLTDLDTTPPAPNDPGTDTGPRRSDDPGPDDLGAGSTRAGSTGAGSTGAGSTDSPPGTVCPGPPDTSPSDADAGSPGSGAGSDSANADAGSPDAGSPDSDSGSGRPAPCSPPTPGATLFPDSPGRPPAGPAGRDAHPGRQGRSSEPTPPLGERPPRGGSRRAPAQVHVHVDYDALLRGYATDGEHCEVPGLGPVPVALARHLANDAILHLVLTGTDVTVISSHRRYVPASVERALRARDQECVVPGCHARHHLQMHHWPANFAAGCPTSLATLARICRFHHHLVTTCNWRLTGGPGQWTLLAPGARDPDEPP